MDMFAVITPLFPFFVLIMFCIAPLRNQIRRQRVESRLRRDTRLAVMAMPAARYSGDGAETGILV
jgi:hypothetical protein